MKQGCAKYAMILFLAAAASFYIPAGSQSQPISVSSFRQDVDAALLSRNESRFSERIYCHATREDQSLSFDLYELSHHTVLLFPLEGKNLPKNQFKPTCWTSIRDFLAVCYVLCICCGSLITSWLSSIFGWYQGLLVSNPALTKSVSAGFVAFNGDVLAQVIERSMQKDKPIDVQRTCSVAMEGMLVSGPILHFSYELMDVMISHMSLNCRWFEAFLQLFIDFFVLDSMFVATLMIISGVLEGRYRDIPRELRTEYVGAVRGSWVSSVIMVPIQFLNFGFMPLRFRTIVTNMQDVVWSANVSYMAHRYRD